MGFFTWLKEATGIDLTTKNIEKSLYEPLIEKPVQWVKNEVVVPVLNKIGDTVKAVLQDPIPFIAQVAGSFVGIPPYVTAAAITAARGGDVSDIAKSAAVAYVGSKAFTSTSIGQSAGKAASAAGDFTANLAGKLGVDASTATLIGSAAQSGFSNATIGGIRAIVTGRDVGDAITSGFTQGSIYSASNSYFGDIKKQEDWGITPSTAKQLAGLTSSAAIAAVSGQDPEQAISNYIAYATLETAKSELKKGATYLWDQAKEFANNTSTSKAVYDQKQEDYNKQVETYHSKIEEFNAAQEKLEKERAPYVEAYQKNLDGYNEQLAIYNNASNSVEVRNAAATSANAYAAEMQKNVDESNKFNPQLDALKKQADELSAFNKNLTDPTTGIAKELKDASEVVQSNYDNYNKTIAEAKAADDAYGKQVAEVATREAFLDAVNNGKIKTVENPDAPEGSVTFENGIVLTPDGKYMKDGAEVFSNAYDIKQSGVDFKTDTGEHYVFDSTGKRLTSETDVQKIFEDEFGIKIDPSQAQKLAGSQYGQEDLDLLKSEAEAKVVEQFNQYGYKAPSQDIIDSFIEKGGDTLANVEKYVDPYYVAEDEVNQFFQQTLGRDATPEEVVKFIGAKDESSTFDERQAAELQKFDNLKGLFGEAMSQGRLPTVNVTAGADSQQDNYFPWEAFFPQEDIPSLGETTVTAKREEEEPLLDLPYASVTPKPVTPVTVTTPTTTTATPTVSGGSSDLSSLLAGLSGLGGTTQPTTTATPTALKPTFLTSSGKQEAWQDVLSPLHQVMSQPNLFEQPQDQPQQQNQLPRIQEPQDMLEPFYKYGTNQSIDDIMAGGQEEPAMAAGGLTGTRHGRYAGGGMATPLMAAGGKLRVDFRHGDAVTGEGDGQSDDIPAMLADGEFVFPADVVAAIGNGSTKAGSDKLYDMMHGIRAHVRSAKPQDLPPEIKSPLQFLNAKPKKARR